MKDLSDADRIGNWAKVQSVGSLLRWTDDSMGPGRPYGQGWMDVRALVDEDLGLNWWWTVVAPGDPEANVDDATTLVVAPDLDVYSVLDLEGGAETCWAVPAGQAPAGEVMRALEAARDAGSEIPWRPGWTPEIVSAALRDWLVEHAGRGDMRVVAVLDPPLSAMADEALRRLDAYKQAGLDAYDLGDGVMAVGPAVDELLAEGPEVAGEVLGSIKRWSDLRRDRTGEG
jgi:hypothetical protein